MKLLVGLVVEPFLLTLPSWRAEVSFGVFCGTEQWDLIAAQVWLGICEALLSQCHRFFPTAVKFIPSKMWACRRDVLHLFVSLTDDLSASRSLSWVVSSWDAVALQQWLWPAAAHIVSWPGVFKLLSPPSTTVKDSLAHPAAYPQKERQTSPSSL